MKTGILTFQNYHGRKRGTIGSSVIRGDWLVNHWPDARAWKTGEKYDAIIFQKVYWSEFMEDYKGIKILDICDPDWIGGNVGIKEISYLVDAITCSTDALRDYLRQVIKHIPVITIKDRIDLHVFANPKTHVDQAKTCVWFGYSHNAQDLLGMVLPALATRNLSLKVVSDTIPEIRTTYGVDIQFKKWIPETAYHEIQQADIMINPINPFVPRFKYKSNNRTVSAWGLGLPVAANEDELDVFLGATIKDNKYIVDHDKGTATRNKEAREKYELVKTEYDVRQSVKEYQALIAEIQAKK